MLVRTKLKRLCMNVAKCKSNMQRIRDDYAHIACIWNVMSTDEWPFPWWNELHKTTKSYISNDHVVNETKVLNVDTKQKVNQIMCNNSVHHQQTVYNIQQHLVHYIFSNIWKICFQHDTHWPIQIESGIVFIVFWRFLKKYQYVIFVL